MKTFLITQILLFICLQLHSQSIEFFYDGSGNRVTRQVIELKSTRQDIKSEQTIKNISAESGDLVVTVFPNPVKEELTINIDGFEESLTVNITIIDIGGKLLLSQRVYSSTSQIDFSRFPRGNYFLNILKGSEKLEWKIVKE